MLSFAKFSIQNKIRLIIVLTTGISLFVSAVALVMNQAIIYRQDVVEELQAYANVVSANITAAIAFQDRNGAAQNLSAFSAKSGIIGIFVYDKNGNIFAKNTREDDSLPGGIDLYMKTFVNASSRESTKESPGGEIGYIDDETISVFVPSVLDGDIVGFIEIQFDTNGIYSTIYVIYS